MKLAKAQRLVEEEYYDAVHKFPIPFHTNHEGHGIIIYR